MCAAYNAKSISSGYKVTIWVSITKTYVFTQPRGPMQTDRPVRREANAVQINTTNALTWTLRVTIPLCLGLAQQRPRLLRLLHVIHTFCIIIIATYMISFHCYLPSYIIIYAL
jgi:hypothetical protein